MIRRFLCLLVILSPLLTTTAATVASAYSRYYEAGEIRPIRQYFGASLIGQGFRTVIASQPEQPQGQYFIAKLEGDKSSQVNTARLTVYPSVGKDARVFTLDLAGKSLRRWLYLGLTGSDWPDPDIQPMAWKIELLGPGGELVSEWQSFLWEM